MEVGSARPAHRLECASTRVGRGGAQKVKGEREQLRVWHKHVRRAG